jgi:S-DNA-T family DNA segregation ATPase FtsK/SpoIIIE
MFVERSGMEPRPLLPEPLGERLLGILLKATGLGLVLLAAAGWLSLMTWSSADPSLTHATSGVTRNALGPLGAILSDIVLQTLGFTAIVVFLGPAWAGVELVLNERLERSKARSFLFIAATGVAAGALSSLPAPEAWPLNHGLGGAFGDFVFNIVAGLIGLVVPGKAGALAGLVLCVSGMSLLSSALGMGQKELVFLAGTSRRRVAPDNRDDVVDSYDPPIGDARDETTFVREPWLPEPPVATRAPDLRRPELRAPTPHSTEARWPDPRAGVSRPDHRPQSPRDEAAFNEMPAVASDFDQETAEESRQIAERFKPNISTAPGAKKPSRKAGKVITQLISARPNAPAYKRPSVNLLKRPPASRPGPEHTQPVLRGSARLLEDVLGDFGIKGEIKGIKPGPVVTLFELEPARGTKASRIIALSDDIARSMSAVSARVAPVPGRNVIGIELPNVRRETVYLRELLEHDSWRNTEAHLPVVLGKSIGGEPIIADLARMPHLLVAGTTGSGKSVGVNALILSLLYRLSPEECRFLMIDPKMLELSVYNGIPHLLAPVVTDPHRAAAALGWVVSEMEERYKRMAELNVRNVDMYNVRVKNAKKRGERLGRTVQTGFDEQTGEAILVREERDPETMPYIVVIVDEFADLMAVAGKEVEGAVQRLAQMARAAGIHLVMATQRPSVDVVTGTIKANFPTRIAFRVASKIDSRTIISEQGAEQLLGAGDMLYSAGSGQIVRVHGPFVSDDEVESLVAALKSAGEPTYVDGLARKIDEASSPTDGPAIVQSAADAADEMFDRAVAIVHRDGKASTSYLQRRLGIGYNRAADLIERMESEGLISPADSVGRRRVLLGEDEAGTGTR